MLPKEDEPKAPVPGFTKLEVALPPPPNAEGVEVEPKAVGLAVKAEKPLAFDDAPKLDEPNADGVAPKVVGA